MSGQQHTRVPERTYTRILEARCPNCGPRLWFDCEEHERHEIPSMLPTYDLRTELVCACGESVLVATEPVDE
jgi:hypothetical protein